MSKNQDDKKRHFEHIKKCFNALDSKSRHFTLKLIEQQGARV